MLLVTTIGGGSMDTYAQHLAQHAGVPTLPTDVYQRVAELFNVPLLSRSAAAAFSRDVAFIRTLRRLQEPVHLPNHHLGRYGLFLSVPYVVTVHDLIRYFDLQGAGPFIHRPNLRDRLYLRLDYAGIRRATAILAVSETTKRELIQHLGIPAERITVTYEGIDHDRFRPVERRLVEPPYILFVGSEHPRKNLAVLFQALRLLKAQSRFRALTLVKVGAPGGREAPFRRQTLAALAAAGLERDRDVIFTERVSDEDLPAYYSGAACLVLPSLYEGFGFPPVEAMACGCPVIVSNRGALPEIVGDAAVTVDPHDPEKLAAAIEQVLVDGRTRHELVHRGFNRARRFTWERTAERTRAVYQSLERTRLRGRPPARGAGRLPSRRLEAAAPRVRSP